MSTAELIGTGVLMGTVHGLAGLDHQSALATLSGSDISEEVDCDGDAGGAGAGGGRRRLEQFLLGVKWGPCQLRRPHRHGGVQQRVNWYGRAAVRRAASFGSVGVFDGVCERCLSTMCTAPSLLALLAGVVHGAAGPEGVLGVIPAVQLRNAKLASIYLGTFCLASTLVMGGFAACYGTLSERLAGGRGRDGSVVPGDAGVPTGNGSGGGNRVFIAVEAGSASLSLAVEMVWLARALKHAGRVNHA